MLTGKDGDKDKLHLVLWYITNNNLIKARTNSISSLVHNINIQVIGDICSHIFKLNTEGMHQLCGALVYFTSFAKPDLNLY